MPSEFDVDSMPEDGQNISSAYTPSRTSAVFDYDNHTETNTGHHGAAKMAQTSPVTTPTEGIPVADGGTSKSMRILPRDVWSPPITAPDDSAVWTTGSMVKVTWCVLSSVSSELRDVGTQ